MLRLVTLLALVATPARAQTDTTQTAPAPLGTPVVYRGDTLFYLSGTLGPFTPEERAAAVARRIAEQADDPLTTPEQLVVSDSVGATDVRVGNTIIVTVTDRDAAEAGVDRATLGEQFATAIRGALANRTMATNLRSILFGTLFTILATLALIVVFMGLNRLFPWLYAKIDSWRNTLIPNIRIQRLEVLSSDRLTDAVMIGAKVARVAAVILVLYFFIPLVLSFFPWTRDLSTTIFDWVLTPLKGAWDGFVTYLPNLFTVAVIIAVFYYLLKFIHLFFLGIANGAIALPSFHRDWADPTYKIVRFLVIVFGIIVIFPYLPGSNTAAFRGVSVFVGVLFTFGSSSAIANIVAGVVMTYMRPFQIGDRVKIADTVGDVVEKTLLITRIRTTKNVDITVPNAMVLSSHIINYSSTAKEGGVILHTGVTIGYDVPWRQVHQLLINSATATAGIMQDPKPFVLQTSLDDFYVSYELNAYTSTPNAMARIYSELHQHIQDEFAKANVEIMSPHYRANRDGPNTTPSATVMRDAAQPQS